MVDGSEKYPDSYGIIVNYAVGNFKFGFRFLNWFKTRGFADLEMQSDRYDFYNHEAFTDASRMLGMSIQYTFTYGKKVDRGGEIKVPCCTDIRRGEGGSLPLS